MGCGPHWQKLMGRTNGTESAPEEEGPPINVDTGDSVKVKLTLDKAFVKAVLEHGYGEHHSLDNVKLLLMLAACIFAMVAQFWPLPFPKSRPLLGECCSMQWWLFPGLYSQAPTSAVVRG